ncbi:hypothetical protein KM043_016598 [Ampulex compressa]|nr:hypothetical protein KM043_016598 [Ampulex compressa]
MTNWDKCMALAADMEIEVCRAKEWTDEYLRSSVPELPPWRNREKLDRRLSIPDSISQFQGGQQPRVPGNASRHSCLEILDVQRLRLNNGIPSRFRLAFTAGSVTSADFAAVDMVLGISE